MDPATRLHQAGFAGHHDQPTRSGAPSLASNQLTDAELPRFCRSSAWPAALDRGKLMALRLN
jgi:hypothetical protein